jgi:predicted transcriptional regulator
MAIMGNGNFLFWGFRPPRELLRARLGTLERQVIEILWTSDEVTVRDVHVRLDGKVAYTTVMTTLDRLFRKGLLARTKRARAFVYSAVATREELDDIVASDVVSGLLAGEWSAPLPFLSNLVDAVGERDRALLDELERLVRTKRRQLNRGGGRAGGVETKPGIDASMKEREEP